MALELYRLIKKVSHMDISLVAGKGGLSNMVSWVHMVESMEASSFLEGGEIAFSTGIGLNNSTTLLNLVQNIYKRDAAGLVLNTGPFLETIPDEVIRFGDEHDFPIFSVPWKIHIAEIMRIFCFDITKEDQLNLEIAAAFKNAIFFPQQEELYIVPLSQRGFHLGWSYYVCVLKITDAFNNVPSNERLNTICIRLTNHMSHRHYSSQTMFCNENQLLIVLGNYDIPLAKAFITDMSDYLTNFLHNDETYFLGVGKCTKSIRCLHKSYRQALAILHLHQYKKIDKNLIFYENMGIYKLLMGIEDKDILTEYYEKTILPLVEYDQKNNSDLVSVLRCYLKNDGSVNKTADELYVHRNTVNYKINKSSEILNMDISKLNSRLQLTLGLMLGDML